MPRVRAALLLTLAAGALMVWPLTKSCGTEVVKNAYNFTFHKLMGGDDLPLSVFKGEVILVVNTASKCGFTPQYDGLEKLYEKYRARGFVIVGVPSNDFGSQEPGTNEEISSFCKLNYGVEFPMASKEDVIGDNAHPFYKWARSELGLLTTPKWNFHKYLINRKGELVNYFFSTTSPDSGRLQDAIEAELDKPAE